jgi:hypothetical protein
MGFQIRGQRFRNDHSHPQQRILHRETRLRRWIRQHLQHRSDYRV